MLKNRYALIVAAPLLMLACTEPPQDEPTPDLATPPPPPDMAMLKCELPYELRDIDKVSMGAVNIKVSPTDPMGYTAEIDATAGGSSKWMENPFLYIDLVGRKRVDITDIQAQTSKDWDIAIKRWQIKINSGDSGTGGVTVAHVDGKDLDEVTAAPAGPYKADDYFDDKCKLSYDRIFGLATALERWYDYDESGMSPMPVSPHKGTFVLKRRDGQGHIKLQILGYYKGMFGGNYTITWSDLP